MKRKMWLTHKQPNAQTTHAQQGIEGSQTEMFALAAKKWHMSEDNPKNQEKEKKRKHDDPEKKKKKYKKKDDSP